MNRQKGMTIVELMVALAVLLIVIGAATAAYLKLLKGYKSQNTVSRSYMANMTGFELLRYDIEMSGFGLPLDLSGAANLEAADLGGERPPITRPLLTMPRQMCVPWPCLTIRASTARMFWP